MPSNTIRDVSVICGTPVDEQKMEQIETAHYRIKIEENSVEYDYNSGGSMMPYDITKQIFDSDRGRDETISESTHWREAIQL